MSKIENLVDRIQQVVNSIPKVTDTYIDQKQHSDDWVILVKGTLDWSTLMVALRKAHMQPEQKHNRQVVIRNRQHIVQLELGVAPELFCTVALSNDGKVQSIAVTY